MTENRSGNEGITHANLVTHFNFRIQHMKIVLDSHYFCICIAYYYFSADLAYFSKSFFQMIHQTCCEKGVYNCKEHLRTIVIVKSCKTCVTNEKIGKYIQNESNFDKNKIESLNKLRETKLKKNLKMNKVKKH